MEAGTRDVKTPLSATVETDSKKSETELLISPEALHSQITVHIPVKPSTSA